MNTKKNLWPYGIITAFAIFMTGTIGLIVLACSHRTELVSDDYYEQEIRFQSQMERQQRASTQGASVIYEPRTHAIRISVPSGTAPGSVSGRIHLYRPSAAGLDRKLSLELDAQGTQLVDATRLSAGLWKVRVTWSAGTQEYYLDQSVIVPHGVS
jgi:nitrogen fixation protein FixH